MGIRRIEGPDYKLFNWYEPLRFRLDLNHAPPFVENRLSSKLLTSSNENKPLRFRLDLCHAPPFAENRLSSE